MGMKLRHKLSLLAAGSVLVTALIAAFFAHIWGKGVVEDQWQTRFRDFAQALALPVSRAVFEGDLVLLDAYAYDLKSWPFLYIKSVRILNAQGEVLVSAGEEGEKEGRPFPSPAGQSLIPISAPLSWNGQTLGELQIAFVDTPIASALARMYRLILIIALLGSLGAIGVSLGIARRLLRPMNAFVEQVRKLRRGEPVPLTPIASNDEIAEMSRSFVELYKEIERREEQRKGMLLRLEELAQKLSHELALNTQLRERLEEENRDLRKKVEAVRPATALIGEEGDLAPVVEQARRVAQSDLTVLLSGESGTGKEVLARYIHQCSSRHEKRLVTVNCAALPEGLIESELFGHEKGAFTGASEKRLGKFVLADGGTVFLDEIGELPLSVQPKLLRVLESGQVDRIGAREPIRVSVRVIAATNRDLAKEVAAGRFREDLYYRLKVVHIVLPPLRERPRDLAALAQAFMEEAASTLGLSPPLLSPAALDLLQSYSWPGNVRELKHVLAAALSQNPVAVLEPKHISPLLQKGSQAVGRFEAPSALEGQDFGLDSYESFDSFLALQERCLLEGLLLRCRSQKEMAQYLKVSEARLHRLLKKHRLLGWRQRQLDGPRMNESPGSAGRFGLTSEEPSTKEFQK